MSNKIKYWVIFLVNQEKLKTFPHKQNSHSPRFQTFPDIYIAHIFPDFSGSESPDKWSKYSNCAPSLLLPLPLDRNVPVGLLDPIQLANDN